MRERQKGVAVESLDPEAPATSSAYQLGSAFLSVGALTKDHELRALKHHICCLAALWVRSPASEHLTGYIRV